MICKICGVILANDDIFHKTKIFDKTIIVCKDCQLKRYYLDAKMRDALKRVKKFGSVDIYNKTVYKNTLPHLKKQIDKLCYNNSKLAKKIEYLINKGSI